MDGVFQGSAKPDHLRDANYWLDLIPAYAAKWDVAQRDRLASLRKDGVKIAYWRSDEHGRPACGGDSPIEAAASPFQQLTARGKSAIKLCTNTVLHASLRPPRWRGSRLWIVALHGEVIGTDEKFGARCRETIGEAIEFAMAEPSDLPVDPLVFLSSGPRWV